MKYSTKIVVAACLACSCVAQARAGEWRTDHREAVVEAAMKDKFLLLNFSGSDWCGWCQKLDSEVFSQSAFGEYAEKNLIRVLVDSPRKTELPMKLQQQNAVLKRRYDITGFPTIVLLTPDGVEIGRTSYRQGGAEKYVKRLDDMIAPHKWVYWGAKDPVTGVEGVLREWKSISDETIQAKLLTYKNGLAALETESGKIKAIGFEYFSHDDRMLLDPQKAEEMIAKKAGKAADLQAGR